MGPPPAVPLPRPHVRLPLALLAKLVRLVSLTLAGFLVVEYVSFEFATGGKLRVGFFLACYFAFLLPIQGLATELLVLAVLSVASGLVVAFDGWISTEYLGSVIVGVVAGMLGLAFAFALFRNRISDLMERATRRARTAGDPAARRVAIEGVVRSARFTVGVTRARQLMTAAQLSLEVGDLREACELLVAAERGTRGYEEYGQRIAAQQSLLLALQGELAAAAAWAAEARRRPPPVGEEGSLLHLLAEAIAASRQGNAEEAARRIEEAWPMLEKNKEARCDAALPIRAVLLTEVARPPPEPLTRELLHRARWAGTAWPELAAFLAQHAEGADEGRAAALPA